MPPQLQPYGYIITLDGIASDEIPNKSISPQLGPAECIIALDGMANDEIPNATNGSSSLPIRESGYGSMLAEVDTHDDNDFMDDGPEGSSTFSVNSSHQYLFQKRHGRTYHTFSAHRDYLLPNDEPERDRMDMQFWAIIEVLGHRYFHAPIADNPQDIIDIGTGTGMWAIEVAEKYPSASIIGTDLSPMQPTWVPPNVTFELHDCLQDPWEFSRQFDLIHTQLLNGFAVKHWHEFYTECFRNLKPGGWVESHECDLMLHSDDNSIPNNSAVIRWLNLWDEGAGRGFRITGAELGDIMGRVGFVDVVVKKIKAPIGAWDKTQLNAGMLSLTAVTEHMEGISMRVFMEKLGMTEEEMRRYTEPAVREWRSKNFHSYWDL
jgi:trans-aconitate methyltransferase